LTKELRSVPPVNETEWVKALAPNSDELAQVKAASKELSDVEPLVKTVLDKIKQSDEEERLAMKEEVEALSLRVKAALAVWREWKRLAMAQQAVSKRKRDDQID
jgi:hypothetical protein